MLAMLTAGSMGFTACSSDDVVDGGNTNNGVAGKMVKTSFALNIPYGNKSGRMSVEETQANSNATTGTFNGMSDMRLLSFNGDVTNANLRKKICLGGTKDAFQTDNRRSVYRDVTIPVGTTNFLFYGETYDNSTIDATSEAGMNRLFEVGSLEASTELKKDPNANNATDGPDKDGNGGLKLENINFSLKKILTTTFAADPKGQVIAEQLSKVYTTSFGGKTWSEIAGKTDKTVEEKHAAEMFNKFKNLTAGSANAVKLTLQELKKSCGREVPASLETAQDILEAIAFNANAAITAINYQGNNTDFPRNLGMPDGAAKGSFNSDGDFTYNLTSTTIANSGIDYTKITYPAALNYFIQTDLGANNDPFNTLSNWPTIQEWLGTSTTAYDWADKGWGDKVLETTRTIALKTPIQYGVANLESNVTVTASTLEDNAIEQGKLLANQKISTSNSKYFTLKGILVGAQPASVNWDYTPTAAAYDHTIYDRQMTTADNKIYNGGVGTTNYTLVLDNANATTKSVYVTLELVNNTGVDFYGVDGLVPDGGTFYLVGTLDPETGGNGDSKQDHVFVKSHRTIANFHIGAESLKKAYNTIPDLRSTQISLGLAVDLEWKDGITFTVDL